tara:strand:- start:41 stop:487 length:447 start_codon:yes stop_codon:yes gene_type:complete
MGFYNDETSVEKWLYFRQGTTAVSEDDEATGSNMYPASHLLGMLSGDSDGAGSITDADGRLSIFLKPIRKTQTAEANAADANPDVIMVSCAQYGQRRVMNAIVASINAPLCSQSDGVIVICDNGAGGTANRLEGITGMTIKSQLAAAN